MVGIKHTPHSDRSYALRRLDSRTLPVKSYKVHIQERVPEEEWFIAEDAIPAVMSREKFDKVQNALNRDTRRSPKEVDLYLFSGFLRCADCRKS